MPSAWRGDAKLEFVRGGQDVQHEARDADVKRPLASAGAIVDEGNTVVFGLTARVRKSPLVGRATYAVEVCDVWRLSERE